MKSVQIEYLHQYVSICWDGDWPARSRSLMQSVCIIAAEFLLWCFGPFLVHFFPLAWVSRHFTFYKVTVRAACPAPNLVGGVYLWHLV